jgi:predicted ATPase
MMTAFGISDHSGRWPLSLLVDFLAGRDLLLVLDNCEHVLDACAIAADEILRRSASVRIIATSRQPLGTRGETVYPVSGLAIPETEEAGDLSQVQQFGAVALFCQRAAAATGYFALTEANKTSVLELCRRLDGLPLAIELASVRTRSLPVEEIVFRLRDRFLLLKSGGAAVQRRQRTLEATIDWSYELLQPPEQAMLRSLAVFAGGVDLEAAEAVSARNGVDRDELIDLLSSLVDRSLLQKADAGIGPRYRFHETTREYGLLKLKRLGELDSTRVAHLQWYSDLAAQVEADSFGPRLPEWFRRLDHEVANIRAALQFCLEHPEHVDVGLELAASLHYWWRTRAPAEASTTIQALLGHGGGEDQTRSHALWVLAALTVALGDFELSDSALREALARARRTKDIHAIAMALSVQALLQISGKHDLAAARLAASDAHSLAAATGDAMADMYATLLLGLCDQVDGDLDEAQKHLDVAIGISRHHRETYLLAQALLVAAINHLSSGSLEDADADLKEALRITRQLDNRAVGVTSLLEAMAALAVARGQASRAARLQGGSANVLRQQGLPGHHPYTEPLAAATSERAKKDAGCERICI